MGPDGSRRHLQVLASEGQDVGLVGLFTESSYGVRASARILMGAQRLRAEGRAPGVFMVHFDARDPEQNQRRVTELVERLRARGIRDVFLDVPWAAELTDRLTGAGINAQVMPNDGPVSESSDARFGALPAIELVGVAGNGIQNVDLTIGQTCSYRRPVKDSDVYRDAETTHVGCAYCLGAKPDREPNVDAQRIRARLTDYRRELPDLKVVWIPFLETLLDEVGEMLALPGAREIVAGIDLAFQSRPDVLLRHRDEIEKLAAAAHAAGTRLRLALVGFENFAPRELAILNRGVTPEQLTRAAELLDAWRAQPPPGLLVRGFVPSFIAFNPWTTFDDLQHTSRAIRAHGLMNANIERLRIDPQMPLHEKLVASGLVSSAPVVLEVHPNGYTGETGYRFADERVGAVSAGFALLKPLAMSDQAALLEAVIDAVERAPSPPDIDWLVIRERYLAIRTQLATRPRSEGRLNGASVREIESALSEHGLSLGFPALDRPPQMRGLGSRSGSEVRLTTGNACENRCVPCVWNRRLDLLSDVELPLTVDVRGAHVSIAGREPLARADLPQLIAAAKAKGAVRVDITTNARRLPKPRHVRALADAGLDMIVVKLFGADPSTWDAHTGVAGSFAQTLRAIALVSLAAPEIVVGGIIHPTRAAGERLADLVRLARRIRLPSVRVTIRLANVDLLALDALETELAALPAAFVIELET